MESKRVGKIPRYKFPQADPRCERPEYNTAETCASPCVWRLGKCQPGAGALNLTRSYPEAVEAFGQIIRDEMAKGKSSDQAIDEISRGLHAMRSEPLPRGVIKSGKGKGKATYPMLEERRASATMQDILRQRYGVGVPVASAPREEKRLVTFPSVAAGPYPAIATYDGDYYDGDESDGDDYDGGHWGRGHGGHWGRGHGGHY
jgi:hypothetical protein